MEILSLGGGGGGGGKSPRLASADWFGKVRSCHGGRGVFGADVSLEAEADGDNRR